MRILLVEPEFPYPNKSKNQANHIHKNFVPVGLLKLGSYYRSLGNKVKLVRGNQTKRELRYFLPEHILVTSIFTYWSKYVWDAIKHYRGLFPKAEIQLGGIYSTLHHRRKYFQENLRRFRVKCHIGLHKEAEKFYPDYSLLNGDIKHHVTHAMRGCIRKCSFCGVWKIEPNRQEKASKELVEEIEKVGKNRVIFFDNNFLANRNIKQILLDLSNIKIKGHPVIFESQSGFDGRLLQKKPELAGLLKQANFQNVRIAWDNSLTDAVSVKKQLNLLTKAGYRAEDIYIFMIYNYETTYEDMIKKLNYCKRWGVQIADCRYRPLESCEDKYNPARFRTGQTKDEYYIHEATGWSDRKVRNFRKKVRQHNIWIRYAKGNGTKYDSKMEKWSGIHNTFKFFNLGRPPQYEVISNSKVWENRLRKLRMVKNRLQKENLPAINFGDLKKKEIDNSLDLFLCERG